MNSFLTHTLVFAPCHNEMNHFHERYIRLIQGGKTLFFEEFLEHNNSVSMLTRNLEILATEILSPLHITGLFLNPLKILENLWFSDVFRGYRKGPVARNRLKCIEMCLQPFSVRLFLDAIYIKIYEAIYSFLS